MAETTIKIMKCTCKNEFQDKTYGKGNRVHTVGKGATTKATCTVCLSPKS